jgi:hypothetical protein
MKIADDVVGRHPFAKPLFERVASQAEIDLISDHVQLRWVHDGRRSQPTAVKVLGPPRDAQKPFGNLEPGPNATAGNIRGEIPLGDEGPNFPIEHAPSSLTVPADDSTPRPEADHSQEPQQREHVKDRWPYGRI